MRIIGGFNRTDYCNLVSTDLTKRFKTIGGSSGIRTHALEETGARLIIWRLHLEEHECNIVYKPGTANTNSDALSRIAPINSTSNVGEYSTDTYEKHKEDIQTKIIMNPNVVEEEGDLLEAIEDFALEHYCPKILRCLKA